MLSIAVVVQIVFCLTVSKSCIIHRSITLMLLRLNQTFQYPSFITPPPLHHHTDNSFSFVLVSCVYVEGLKERWSPNLPLVTMNLHFVFCCSFKLFVKFGDGMLHVNIPYWERASQCVPF